MAGLYSMGFGVQIEEMGGGKSRKTSGLEHRFIRDRGDIEREFYRKNSREQRGAKGQRAKRKGEDTNRFRRSA